MGLQESADALLQRAIGDVPGVVAAATDRDGDFYASGFGESEWGTGQAMTPDTVVWIASMTKAVTGAAAMQLVEQGRLSLDAPARAVVPDLEGREVLTGFDAEGQPKLRPAQGEITLRNLLTHTCGFVYHIFNADMARYLEVTGTPDINSCENAALSLPLSFDPGTRWDYGIGIDWAGKMVEAVSGQTLGEYLRENLFEPLGMSSTAFRISDDMRGRLARVHGRAGEGEFEVQATEIPQEPEFEMGGGGLYSTVVDYSRFVRMLLNDGRSGNSRVLEPETVAQMCVNQMGANRIGPLKTAVPELSNDSEFLPGIEKTFGLSFMINEQATPTGRPAGSLAWAGLANSYYWIDRKNGIGGVYATQILPFADAKSAALFEAFEKTVYETRA